MSIVCKLIPGLKTALLKLYSQNTPVEQESLNKSYLFSAFDFYHFTAV